MKMVAPLKPPKKGPRKKLADTLISPARVGVPTRPPENPPKPFNSKFQLKFFPKKKSFGDLKSPPLGHTKQ